MKKICHMTSVHERYDVRIFEKECTSLADNNFDVYLIVNDMKDDEVINGVNIVSTGFKPMNRLQRMLYSTRIVMRRAMEIDADIYHFHDPELLSIALKLKKHGKKVIFDAHENVTDQIMDKNWIPKILRKAVSIAYSFHEKRIVKRLDAVITVSPQYVDYYSKINRQVVLITNYPVIATVADRVLRRESDAKPISYLCFAGGITEQWCHANVIQAITELENVRYILAGYADAAYLEYLKTLPGWEKVEYYGPVPHEKVKDIYSKATLGVAINYANQIKGIGTLGNTKLFEFMEAKLPLICTDYVLWKDIIDEFQCGRYVNPLDISQIKNVIQYIIDNPQEAISMGENGRKAVEKIYNWKVEETKLVDLYDKL